VKGRGGGGICESLGAVCNKIAKMCKIRSVLPFRA